MDDFFSRPGTPRPIPPLNSDGVPTPTQPDNRDILAIALETHKSPVVLAEPLLSRPHLEQSPSCSEWELEVAKTGKTAQKENVNPSSSRSATLHWGTELRKAKKRASKKVKSKISRGKLADLFFDQAVCQATTAEEREANTNESPYVEVLGEPDTLNGTWKRLKKRMRQTLCLDAKSASGQPIPQLDHEVVNTPSPNGKELDKHGVFRQSLRSIMPNSDKAEHTVQVLPTPQGGNTIQHLAGPSLRSNALLAMPIRQLPEPDEQIWLTVGQPSKVPIDPIVPSVNKKLDVCITSVPRPTTRPVQRTIRICFRNGTNSDQVYVVVTGMQGRQMIAVLLSEETVNPLVFALDHRFRTDSDRIAIPVGASGSATVVNVPWVQKGKIWISIGEKLEFQLERYLCPEGYPIIRYPNVSKRDDPNFLKKWASCDFDFSDGWFNASFDYMDSVSIPVGLILKNSSGSVTKTVPGIPSNGLETICQELWEEAQRDTHPSAQWKKLIIRSGLQVVRILSPKAALSMNSTLFTDYLEDYIDAVWKKFSEQHLAVNCRSGVQIGVSMNEYLDFGDFGFRKPATTDVFSCTWDLKLKMNIANPAAPQAHILALAHEVGKILSAAFNRSLLLHMASVPEEDTSNYYNEKRTNHYARIVNEVNIWRHGHVLHVDDMGPVEKLAARVRSGDPGELTVCIGSMGDV